MGTIDRLTRLEDKVDTHLKESGEVREAIHELKEAVRLLSSRMWSALVGILSLLTVMVGFLLKVTLWR